MAVEHRKSCLVLPQDVMETLAPGQRSARGCRASELQDAQWGAVNQPVVGDPRPPFDLAAASKHSSMPPSLCTLPRCLAAWRSRRARGPRSLRSAVKYTYSAVRWVQKNALRISGSAACALGPWHTGRVP